MKKVIASVLSVAMVAAFAAGCTGNGNETGAPTTTGSNGETDAPTEAVSETVTEKQSMTVGTGAEVVNLWSFTNEIPKMVKKYVELNPEFGEKYTVECTIIATDGGAYQQALDAALTAGGDSAPDMYAAEAAFILKYSQGDMAKFAATYKELDIDVDKGIADAGIAPYTIEIGSRDGEVVALGYQATGGAMIYSSKIAQDVFGTDDQAKIEEIIGAGSGNWDKFFAAAEQLKAKGYCAVSGSGDMWNVVEKSAQTGWIVNGELNIDPTREAFFDIAKTLKDNGYSNDASGWSEAWFADMAGESEHKVFAFFGPAWLLNYTMIEHCGGTKAGEGTYGDWRVCTPPVGFFWGGTWVLGNKDTDNKEAVATLINWITLDCTENGLQYLWANDKMGNNCKDTVASSTVMAMSKGDVEFCGGQDIFPAFINGNKYASAKAMTQYDETINRYFNDAVGQYANGQMDKETALETFKTSVTDNLDF